jgi:hypothetical protein
MKTRRWTESLSSVSFGDIFAYSLKCKKVLAGPVNSGNIVKTMSSESKRGRTSGGNATTSANLELNVLEAFITSTVSFSCFTVYLATSPAFSRKKKGHPAFPTKDLSSANEPNDRVIGIPGRVSRSISNFDNHIRERPREFAE